MAGFDGGDGFVGEFVATFVLGVPGVAFDPVPLDLVLGGGGIEGAPEVGVFDGLLGSGAPAVAFPSGDPLADALADVLRVRVEVDVAGLFQTPQSLNGGLELHAVVRGGGDAALDLADVLSIGQHGGPATGAGIAMTAAVGMDDHFFHRDRVISTGWRMRESEIVHAPNQSSFAITADARSPKRPKDEPHPDTESATVTPRQNPRDQPVCLATTGSTWALRTKSPAFRPRCSQKGETT